MEADANDKVVATAVTLEFEAYTLRDKNPKVKPKWKYPKIKLLTFYSQDEIKEIIRELNNESPRCASKLDSLLPSQRALITIWMERKSADETNTQFDIEQLKIY